MLTTVSSYLVSVTLDLYKKQEFCQSGNNGEDPLIPNFATNMLNRKELPKQQRTTPAYLIHH